MAIVNQYQPSIVARAKQQTAIVELNDPSVTVNFYQVNADGTPDTSVPCALSQIAVGCMAIGQLRGDLSADHAAHRQHHLQERRDVHSDVHAFRRVQLPG